jgi:hypothetical protein
VNRSVHSVHYTLHSVHYTVNSVPYTLHSVHYTVNSTRCTVRSVQYTVHSVHYTVYTVHYTVHTVHHTVHSVHYTVHTEHYTVQHSAQCSLLPCRREVKRKVNPWCQLTRTIARAAYEQEAKFHPNKMELIRQIPAASKVCQVYNFAPFLHCSVLKRCS